MSSSKTNYITQKSTGFYSKLLYGCKAIVKKYTEVPIKYKYSSFFITLPVGHALPVYQKMHPKYDRFLPHIAKYIDGTGTIIDIGANVGDTLASMVEQNATANYICVEADDLFYELLMKNINNMEQSVGGLKVKAIKRLIGKSVSSVSLEGKGGTKHAVQSEAGDIESISLDDLMQGIVHAEVRLLKSDVDGFDYDVLDSAIGILKKDAPIVFFELQYEHEYQKNGYINTIYALDSIGYCDWTIFDNFGEVILRTAQIDVIFQLMNYVWMQNIGSSTRTIHYFDILAVQQKDSNLINDVVNEYSKI